MPSTHLHGYKFLGEAIELIQADDSLIHQVTKVLYPTIAKNFNTKASAVERDIRHSISHGFNSKFDELVYKCPRRDKGPTIPSKPSRSIEDIIKIASANGISYGKAVWLLESAK